jgi:DNA methyltransferase 1-associated protein 1
MRRPNKGEENRTLSLKHWVGGPKDSDQPDERVTLFDKLNCRTDVITYRVGEYENAGLDKLPSSSSWSKEETDTLMELCKQFDLRFTVIADRFVGRLKEKYDQRQLKKLDLQSLCETAIDPETRQPVSDAVKK